MIRPDKRTLESLSRLHSDSDFNLFLAWVESSMEQLFGDFVMSKDADDLIRIQGQCQSLAQLLEHARGARDALSKTGRTLTQT